MNARVMQSGFGRFCALLTTLYVFGLATAQADPKWHGKPGKVHIISNVADSTCMVDHKPCKFEADGTTLVALTNGEHTVELSKADFQPATVVVTVAENDVEMLFELKPLVDPANQLVMVGLRPLDKENGAGDLRRLTEAQAVRSVAQGGLAAASHGVVIGHDDLIKLLGKKYLVAWFDCANQIACVNKLIEPARDAGSKLAVMGDYYVKGDVYQFHVLAFGTADGKVIKELNFALAASDVKDPKHWQSILAPAVSGQGSHVTVSEKVRVVAKVPLAPSEARRSPTLSAIRTTTPPSIDGKLDDPAWELALLETNFTQNFPDEAKPPTQRTDLRVVYDDDAIYVGIHCFDSNPEEIVANLTRRDRDIAGDKVTIAISSKNDKASAYQFQVNAAGVQVDGTRFNDTDFGAEWDGRWYSATTRDAEGWTVEIKIPLVTLRYNGDVSSFGFQVRRYLGRRGEVDEWAYVPRTAKGEVSYYGTLNKVTGLNAKRLFEALVYDARRITFRRHQAQAILDGSDTGGNIGADLKIGVTPALTLDATINPDFGTVEVDQVVLNLTRVETYFPEKRPFFIEGADLFSTPFQLFYSRRIGAHPPSPTAGSIIESIPDGRVWSAVKLSGLLTKRLSIALFDGLTSREDVSIVRMPGDTPEKVLLSPTSNFGVIRLRQDFGTNSAIGIMATSVNRFEPANAATPQATDVCPDTYSPAHAGKCSSNAYTGGIDTHLKTDDGEWGASGQVIGSLVTGGATEFVSDGTVVKSGSMGWGITSEIGRYGGEHWLAHLAYSNSSPRLEINNAGYQDSANFHDFLASVVWRTTKPVGPFRSISVEGFFEHRRDWLMRDNLNFAPEIHTNFQLSNFWSISTQHSPYFIRWVENRETYDGARTQRDPGTYQYLDIQSNPDKPLVVKFTASLLKTFGQTTSLSPGVTLSLRPVPALEFDLIARANWTYNTPRYLETVTNPDASRTYYFMDLDTKNVNVTLRGTYTFTRTLSLQAYLQPFVASGHYTHVTQTTASGASPLLTLESFSDATALPSGQNPDFRKGALNLNLFVRWEYLPLSAFWVVYTHNQDQTPFDPSEGAGRVRITPFSGGPATDVFLLKLSYLWF